MREQVPEILESGRTKHPLYAPQIRGQWPGTYMVMRNGVQFLLICGTGGGWEHVSASVRPTGRNKRNRRLPSWEEMCWIKDLFWRPDECVIQYHPPESDYVNLSEVLHLWRPINQEVPLPPRIMV